MSGRETQISQALFDRILVVILPIFRVLVLAGGLVFKVVFPADARRSACRHASARHALYDAHGAFNDLLMLFLTIEFLGIASYVLVGFTEVTCRLPRGGEILLIGAFSSAVMLYG